MVLSGRGRSGEVALYRHFAQGCCHEVDTKWIGIRISRSGAAQD